MSNPHRFLLCAATILCTACDRQPHSSDRITSAFERPDLHPVHIGLGQDTTRRATLGIIVAARVTDDGRHVVVLDGVPPFVKVFDRHGRLRSAFLEKGGGPQEMNGPAALATSPGSTILVADYRRRISVYDLDGRLLHQASLVEFLPLAAASACDGGWLIYGPKFQDGSYRKATWLHRVRFHADTLQVLSAFPDSMPTDGIGVGRPYGMVSTGDEVVVRHDLGTRPSILTWSCKEPGPRVTPLPRSAGKNRVRTGSPGRPQRVEIGARVQTGLAALGSGFVQADLAVAKTPRESATILEMTRDGRSRRISVPGFYVLRDSRPGVGVLVESEDPVPQLFLLGEDTFLGLFTR